MAEDFSAEHWALLEGIKITENDIKFSKADPPADMHNLLRLFFLQKALMYDNPRTVFEKILSIENNREVLKRELKTIIKFLVFLYNIKNKDNFLQRCKLNSPLRDLLQKYNIDLLPSIPSVLDFNHIISTFPDIVYNIVKKNPNLKCTWYQSLDDYEYMNLKSEYKNPGLLGLVPKGKSFGGFVKVLVHLGIRNHKEVEAALAYCRCIYNSPITPHHKREKWFQKLELKESDCLQWTKVFDKHFPEYIDIHKYFGQIA